MNTNYWIKVNYKDISNKIRFRSEEEFNKFKKIAHKFIIREIKNGRNTDYIITRTFAKLEITKNMYINCLYILILTELNVDPEYFSYSCYPIKVKEAPCNICGDLTRYKCSGCRTAYYCCSDHQKQDWKECHSVVCSKVNIIT